MKEEGRELIYKGPLKRRGGSHSDSGELLVFLLDHALLLAKQKSKGDQFKVYRRVGSVKPLHLPKALTIPVIADSTRTSPHHRYRRNRHAAHRLAPTAQQPHPEQ